VITISPDCTTYYNTFAPNGDGKNDFLEIPILVGFPENKVTVYNRWGHELEAIENYDNTSNTWLGVGVDGETIVDSGIYYFMAESNGTIVTSGWVQVIR